jgi:hypothetical protein
VIVKVVDFGLARLQSSNTHQTLQLQNEKSFVGTPAYVSPEQARNVHDVDIRSDLYSLGCTMYFAIAGHAPFRGDTPLQVIVQHLEKEPEALERCRPEIPPALASIVRRLMAKKREKRFQTPAELISELGFFYSNGHTAPKQAAPYLRAAPEYAPAPIPAYVPILKPKVNHFATDVQADKSFDATKAIPGLATELPEATGEVEKTAAIDQSAAESDQHQATQAVQLADPNNAIHAATVRENAAETSPGKPMAANPAFIEAWREWIGVIAEVGAGRAPNLSGSAYRALQRRLAAECEAYQQSSDTGQRALAAKILALIQPWVSFESLPVSDRAAILSLRARCAQIDNLLGRPSGSVWIWVGALALLTCLFIVGRLLFEHIAELRSTTVVALVQGHPFLSLAGVVPILVALAFYIVNRGRA